MKRAAMPPGAGPVNFTDRPILGNSASACYAPRVMSAEKPVIAIDGPAASGKGTLAKRIAAALDLPYLDTGLLYRATARRMLDAASSGAGGAGEDAAAAAARAVTVSDLARTDLRTPDVDRAASLVASYPAVRAALLDTQRQVAHAAGAVLDGRDIGTVVFPDADAKLFVTADPAERARRRLLQRGEEATQAAIRAERAALEARDRADAERDVAPLAQSPDALLLDTTALSADAALSQALAIIRALLRT